MAPWSCQIDSYCLLGPQVQVFQIHTQMAVETNHFQEAHHAQNSVKCAGLDCHISYQNLGQISKVVNKISLKKNKLSQCHIHMHTESTKNIEHIWQTRTRHYSAENALFAYDAGGALFLRFSQQITQNTRSGAEKNLQRALEVFVRRLMTNVPNHKQEPAFQFVFEDRI